jgi:putative hydrolase of the HAD superfamily
LDLLCGQGEISVVAYASAVRCEELHDAGGLAPSAILFDFFGTLVTYEPDRSRLAHPHSHAFAERLGYRPDHDAFVADWNGASCQLETNTADSHVEFSMRDAADAFCNRVGLVVDGSASVELGSVFLREWQQHVLPVPGASEMLCRLASDRRVGVVSNTHDPAMVPSMLQTMGVDHLMSVMVLSIDHGYRKPHPTIYGRAVELLEVEPSDVLFVGDSYPADYEAPIRQGMRALLIGEHEGRAVPDKHRLVSVLDVESALTTLTA